MKANLYLEQSMQEEQMRETSNADWPAWEAGDANTELDSKYKAVRSVTRSLAARLSAEDQIVQSCPEASPVKWHQAHTTWFFETFVLRQFLTDYQPFREEFSWLFNSYYNSLGEEIPEKKLRALFSRPSLDEILAFRLHVDEAIERLLAGEVDEEASRRIILGLHHEQQHQELALTDIKHAFYSSPLHPAYSALRSVVQKDLPSLELKWHSFDGGLVEIGYSLDATNSFDFCFDNETSRHKVYLEPFQIANRLVTCREYLDFIADGAYSRPEFWLSEGWDMVRQQGWQAPLYWEPDPADETGWRAFTLCGWHSLGALVDTPVCHVSFFEADAYARWRGCRLPTESEWGVCGGEGTAAWDFTRNGRAASSSDARRGHSTTLRRLLGMDSKPIHRLSGIQAACRCPGRVQRQVYVESDDSAGRFVRDSCESYSRNLSKFLSTGDALAVHRNPLGIVEANTLWRLLSNLKTHELESDCMLETRNALLREVQRGLLRRPRSLAPWMFYDAHGSQLFERITALPEYYPARTERSIFASCAEGIIRAARAGRPECLRLVELGAGSASKTGILLDAIVRMQGEVLYMPVDISSDALDMACESIASSLPTVRIEPLVTNYVTYPPQLEPVDRTTLAMYIGSSIGNFSPEEARRILRNLGSQLQPGDALLLGTDMVKDESTLVAAYDDRGGVTAAFNLNILRRLNRELGADFDLDNFHHRAVWNRAESRIEMHLESTRDHRVCIAAAQLYLHFAKGESIHTENSYKFTRQAIRILLEDAGFDVERTWMDDRGWYAVTLARVVKQRSQYQADLCAGSPVPGLVAEFPDVPHQPSV